MTSIIKNNPVAASSKNVNPMRLARQQGVGLVEVIVALVILTLGALAIVNLQTASAIAINVSADHFKINELSQTIVEQLKSDSIRAAAGHYDNGYTDAGAAEGVPTEIANKIASWKSSVLRAIPMGEVSIQCSDSSCTVGLRWYEDAHEGTVLQVFNAKAPL